MKRKRSTKRTSAPLKIYDEHEEDVRTGDTTDYMQNVVLEMQQSDDDNGDSSDGHIGADDAQVYKKRKNGIQDVEDDEDDEEGDDDDGGNDDVDEDESEDDEEVDEDERNLDRFLVPIPTRGLSDSEDSEAEHERALLNEERISKSWGKKRDMYYSADTVEYELSSDDEAAREEEEEVLRLQAEKAKTLNEDDYNIASMIDMMMEDKKTRDNVKESNRMGAAKNAKSSNKQAKISFQNNEIDDLIANALSNDGNGDDSVMVVSRNADALTTEEKLNALQSSNPEMFGFIEESQIYLSELTEIIHPAYNKIKAVPNFKTHLDKNSHLRGLVEYVQLRMMALLTYYSHVSFYFALKAQGKPVKHHGVISHIIETREVLQSIENLSDIYMDEVKKLSRGGEISLKPLTVDDSKSTSASSQAQRKPPQALRSILYSTTNQQSSIKSMKFSKDGFTDEVDLDAATEMYNQLAASVGKKKLERKQKHAPRAAILNPVDPETLLHRSGHRAINRQIEKNAGLRPSRPRDRKTPKTRNRAKYEKALIRRRSQVRTFTESQSLGYKGEETGIKGNVIKSVRL